MALLWSIFQKYLFIYYGLEVPHILQYIFPNTDDDGSVYSTRDSR